MRPTSRDFKLEKFVRQLKEAPVPGHLEDRVLEAVLSTPIGDRAEVTPPRLTLKPVRWIAAAAAAAGFGVIFLSHPHEAWSQVLVANSKAADIVATEDGGVVKVSGNRYAVQFRSNWGPTRTTVDWRYDGKRLYQSSLFKTAQNGKSVFGGDVDMNQQPFGRVRTQHASPLWRVAQLSRVATEPQPVLREPTFFPFASLKAKPGTSLFDNHTCTLFEGFAAPSITNSGSSPTSGVVYVDVNTNRIVGRKITYRSGRELTTHFYYPPSIARTEFEPHTPPHLYDEDEIAKALEQEARHPQTAVALTGARASLLCAATGPDGVLYVIWSGASNQMSLNGVEIAGNRIRSARPLTNLPAGLPLLAASEWRSNTDFLPIAGLAITPVRPIGKVVDLELPVLNTASGNRMQNALNVQHPFGSATVTFNHVRVLAISGEQDLYKAPSDSQFQFVTSNSGETSYQLREVIRR